MIKKSSRKILLWVLLVILVVGLLAAVIFFSRKKERLCPLGYAGKGCEPFCNCKLGWDGARCIHEKTDYSCNHETGVCGEGPDGTMTLAACGADCKKCPDCGQHGKCNVTTGNCDCDTGFKGPGCTVESDYYTCDPKEGCSHSTTVDTTFAYCKANCKACTSEGCLNKGDLCELTKCPCKPGWSGNYCDTHCPNGCYADQVPPHGTCDPTTKRCKCNDGWALSANGDCSGQISTYGCNPDTGCDVNFLGGAMTLAACNADGGCKQCTSLGCFSRNKWCDTSPQA